MIDRWLYDYLIAFVSETHNSQIKSIDNSWSERHPFFLSLPLMMTFEPLHNRLKISVFAESVSIHIAFRSFNDSLTDEICSREIHVSNPHRNDISLAKDCFSQIIFDTFCASSIYNLIEIVYHINIILFNANMRIYL